MNHLERRSEASGPADAASGRLAAASSPPAQRGRTLAVLLTLLVAMGPMSTDLYLPSLPGIALDLAAPQSLVQLTIGLFIAGFAAMMLVCGPLADRFGRKPVLLGCMAIYVLASIACALSSGIGFLLAGRFVQALGACAGPVVGRAIVRDLYEPRDAGRILGYMASAMALAPLVAPFLGGYLEVTFGWRAGFWFLAAYGVLVLAALWSRLEETLPAPSVLSPSTLLVNYLHILRDRTFLGFMLCVAFAFGALFTWISNSAFVVISHFGVAPERFGWSFGVVVAGYALGAYAGSRAGMRWGLRRATGIGVVTAALAGLGLALAGWSAIGGLHAIVGLMATAFVGVGMVMPQSTAGALGPFPALAGTASALLGFLQMMTGLVVNGLSSLWFDGTPRPMVSLNLACALLALAAFWLLLSRRAAEA
ncbi:MAG: multidrug effflux MFS transporter [Geminicoccaceae bacterium]